MYQIRSEVNRWVVPEEPGLSQNDIVPLHWEYSEFLSLTEVAYNELQLIST